MSSDAFRRAPRTSGSCRRPPRILLVDDEAVIRRTLSRLLQKERPAWEIVAVDSAEAALARLENRHFDVVVTDLRMPGMGGEALLKELRLHHPGTARLIHSAQIGTHKQHPASRHAHASLAKPASVRELLDALDQALVVARSLADGKNGKAC